MPTRRPGSIPTHSPRDVASGRDTVLRYENGTGPKRKQESTGPRLPLPHSKRVTKRQHGLKHGLRSIPRPIARTPVCQLLTVFAAVPEATCRGARTGEHAGQPRDGERAHARPLDRARRPRGGADGGRRRARRASRRALRRRGSLRRGSRDHVARPEAAAAVKPEGVLAAIATAE